MARCRWGMAAAKPLDITAPRAAVNAFNASSEDVVTGSNGLADPQKWVKALYVRSGTPGTYGTGSFDASDDDKNKLRALKMEDLPTNKQFAKFALRKLALVRSHESRTASNRSAS